MADRPNDPHRLDMRRFARDAATLHGSVSQQALQRLGEAVLPTPGDVAMVRWTAAGESRLLPGADPELWLHLRAETQVQLVCQRCLQTISEPLTVDRRFMFVTDEEEAARLDEDSEDDVMALPRALDLLALLEDELILALPLVPLHPVCPQPLPQQVGQAASPALDDAPHAFAALAVLRRPRGAG